MVKAGFVQLFCTFYLFSHWTERATALLGEVQLLLSWGRTPWIGRFFVKTSLIGPGLQQLNKGTMGYSNFTRNCPALCVWLRILLICPFLVKTSLIGPGVQQSMPKEVWAIQTLRGIVQLFVHEKDFFWMVHFLLKHLLLFQLYMSLSSSLCPEKEFLAWSIFC